MTSVKRFIHLLGLNLGFCILALSLFQATEFLFTKQFSISVFLGKSPWLLGIMVLSYIFLGSTLGILFSLSATVLGAIRKKSSTYSENFSIALAFGLTVLISLLLFRWVDIPICTNFFSNSFKMRGLLLLPILLSAVWLYRLLFVFFGNRQSGRVLKNLTKSTKPVAFILPFILPVLLSIAVMNVTSVRSGQALSRMDIISKDPTQRKGEETSTLLEALPQAENDTAEPPNLILITIDTLRADHLHLYGYERIQTPNIDGLGKEGAVFLNTITQSSVTLPSHSSLLTARIPPNHGVRNGSSYYLGSDEVTLQRLLGARGYRTAAFVSAEPLNYHFGVSQGFSLYDDRFVSFLSSYLWRIRKGFNFFSLGATIKGLIPSGKAVPERRCDKTIEIAKNWLEKNDGTASPFFVWIHLFDVHHPYSPPPPFDEMYQTPVTPESRRDITGMPVSRQIDLYDGEISFVDSELGKLFAWLKSRDLFDNTLKVITSDHGESFEKDYLYNHAKRLFESIVRVPLIFHYPRLIPEPVMVERQVRLIDVTPTILELLGFGISSSFDGVSLAPFMFGREPQDFPRYATSETDQSRKNNLVSLRTEEWKMVYGIENPERALYRLDLDPEEENNQFQKAADSPGDKMEEIIKKYVEGGKEFSGVNRLELSVEFREKLRALGYVE